MSENTNDAATYGTPYPLAESMSVKITHKGDSQQISSDDQVSEIIYGQGSDDVEMQQKNVPLEDQARLLGHQIVNGIMIRNKEDIPPEVAFAYESKKSNGAIEYDKYLCGTFSEPDKEADSNGEKVSPKFKTMKGSFYPRKFDGNSSKQMESDSPSYNSDNLANWYTTVDGVAPSAIVLSSSTPAANATGVLASVHPVLTFNNKVADYSDVTLMKSDGTLVQATTALDATGKILTITPSAALTSAAVYVIVVAGVTDVFGQTLATSTIKFTVA
jgi:phi13 family phage major tail protein